MLRLARVLSGLAIPRRALTSVRPIAKPFSLNFIRHNSFQVEQKMLIAFTCKKCNTRSSHTFSKQAYTKGTVAVQCPSCLNRHLIADNLKVFDDKNFNLEKFLQQKGEKVGTTTNELVFDDIPKDLRKTLGYYAKDAPKEYLEEDKEYLLEDKKKD